MNVDFEIKNKLVPILKTYDIFIVENPLKLLDSCNFPSYPPTSVSNFLRFNSHIIRGNGYMCTCVLF